MKMRPDRTHKPLAVVDQTDQVIGRATREQAESRAVFLRRVEILVMTSDGQMLLRRRSLKLNDDPGLFDSPASDALQVGESYIEAARRVLSRSLGITPKRLVEIAQLDGRLIKQRFFGRLFVTVDDGPYSIIERETETIEIIPPDDVLWLAGRLPYLLTRRMGMVLEAYQDAPPDFGQL
ncbi:MAG: hypothetical protein Alpg2KO_22130 [Alphaproteobacteria bacterium]